MMDQSVKIERDIDKAKIKNFDAIIIGGGFYGVMIAYEASRRGLHTLLLEKNDFGSATSFNSLRIVHGGLRYLQSLDLHRFKESVGERKWFMKNFPNLTKPISCMMPLYNKGLQRNSIMWAALNLNDLLSANRNKSVSAENSLLSGKVISADKVKEIFPKVNEKELKGGAVWNDGAIDDSQIVLIEILKKACQSGSMALNYCSAKDIISTNNSIEGVLALDEETGTECHFKSKVVINSSGPWSRELARSFHKDFENLFQYSIAWNVLFDTESLSEYALAVTPPRENAGAYFLRPWKNKLFAGTVHQAWDNLDERPMPSDESINSFIEDLNLSIPDLNLSRKNILQIYSGLLPAKKQGTNQIAVREVIIDHSEFDGPKGLYSLSGVKLTTSRLVAEKVVNKIFEGSKSLPNLDSSFDKRVAVEYGVFETDWDIRKDNNGSVDLLKSKIESESVVHLQDLIVRRTTIGDNPKVALNQAKEIAGLFNWDDEKKELELNDLLDYYSKRGLYQAEKNGISE